MFNLISKIAPHLWIGDMVSTSLAPRGTIIVFAAKEYQPRRKRSIHVPLDDDPSGPTPDEAERALKAASRVADLVRDGQSVLVTCFQGRNRSGLISALALVELEGISGAEAVEKVRIARPEALRNPGFVDFLEQIP